MTILYLIYLYKLKLKKIKLKFFNIYIFKRIISGILRVNQNV